MQIQDNTPMCIEEGTEKIGEKPLRHPLSGKLIH